MAVFGDKAARTRIEFSPSSNTQLALALSLGADQGRNEVRPKQVAPMAVSVAPAIMILAKIRCAKNSSATNKYKPPTIIAVETTRMNGFRKSFHMPRYSMSRKLEMTTSPPETSAYR